MEVTLSTEAETGASGFTITGGREQGIIVSQVLKESPHSDIFCIKEGDQLLSATIYFDNITYEDALKILQQSEPYKVQFNLKRKLGKEDIEKMHSVIQIKKEKHIQENDDLICSFKTTESDKTVRKREHKKKRSKKDRLSWPKFQSITTTGFLGHIRSRSTSETNDEETQDTSRVSEIHSEQEDISIKQDEIESSGMQIQCNKTSGEQIVELEKRKQAKPQQRLKEKRSLDSSISVQRDHRPVPKTQLRKGESLHSYIFADKSKDKEDNTQNVIWRETFPEVVIVKEKTLPSPCKVSPIQRRDQTTLQSSAEARIKESPQQTDLGQQVFDHLKSPKDETKMSKQRKKKSKKTISGTTNIQVDDISEAHSSSSHMNVHFQSFSGNNTEENNIPEDEKISTSCVALNVDTLNEFQTESTKQYRSSEINNTGDTAELQQNNVAEFEKHGFQMPLLGISQEEESSGTELTSEKKLPDRQQILSGWKLQMPIIKMPKLPKLQRKSFRSEMVEQSDINTNNIGTVAKDSIITEKEIHTLSEGEVTVDKGNIQMLYNSVQLNLQDEGPDKLSTKKIKLNTDMISEIPVPELDTPVTDFLSQGQILPEEAIIQDNENYERETLLKMPKLKMPSFDTFTQKVKDSGEREHKTFVDLNKNDKESSAKTTKVKLPKVELSLPKFKGHKGHYKVHTNTDSQSSDNTNVVDNNWIFSEDLKHDSPFSSYSKHEIKIHEDDVFHNVADINIPAYTKLNTHEVSENKVNEISKEIDANEEVAFAEDINIVFPHMQIQKYGEYIPGSNEEETEQINRLATRTEFELKNDISTYVSEESTIRHKINKEEQESTITLKGSTAGSLSQELDERNIDISEPQERKYTPASKTLQDTKADTEIKNNTSEHNNTELNCKSKSKNKSIQKKIPQEADITQWDGKSANEKNKNMKSQFPKLKLPKLELSKHFKQNKYSKVKTSDLSNVEHQEMISKSLTEDITKEINHDTLEENEPVNSNITFPQTVATLTSPLSGIETISNEKKESGKKELLMIHSFEIKTEAEGNKTEVLKKKLVTHVETPDQELWEIEEGKRTQHRIKMTKVPKTIKSTESPKIYKTSEMQQCNISSKIKRDFGVENIRDSFSSTTKQMAEEGRRKDEIVDTGRGKTDVFMKMSEETAKKNQEIQTTEPKTQILMTLAESSICKTKLPMFSTLQFGLSDQRAIVNSSVAVPQQLKEDTDLEFKEKEAETRNECISTTEKETSSWGRGIQLPTFNIPLFGKSDKPANITESEDASKPKEELNDKTEITERETGIQSVSLSLETEQTTVPKEEVKVELQQEEEKPKPDTDTVKSFETQKEVKESEIVQKELSIQVEPSVQEHWEVQGKGKRRRKKVTKVEKTVITTESQEQGATSPFEKYDVTSKTNVEFEDIDDTLSPTEELQPQKEIAEIETIKTEKPETKVFLTMSEGRVDTTVTTQETKIVQPTKQILQMITESSIGETQLSTSTMLTFATTEQTQIAVATKDIPLQEEDIQVDSEEKERETTQEPRITEPKTQILEVSEERVDTVITTQENQITEPKVQILETVREAFIGETQLQAMSTLAFAQPDQTAIADSSVDMPQLSEDIKLELEEKEAETSSECISNVEKDTSSWGWGIQLPVFKIPLFGKSEKPADLTESEDSSKPKKELKDDTEITQGKTVVESVSLSVETEPTTVPKEEVKVELQQEKEKPKPDTDTVKLFEKQKEVKESEIVQKELSIQVEPSVQEHWEVQGKGKRRRKKVTKVGKTVITSKSQEVGATSPFEEYDVTSQTKVEFEDIDDTLSPTEELQPQKEIAEMETIKTETPETKVFLTMSEGRVDTAAATQDTQITQPTTQILESEDSSKHKEELKDETEIKEGKTFVETVSLSVEIEPTTIPKEEVKVELQQEEEKPKPDTDTVKLFEKQKKVKESEIVQKELSIQVEPSVQEHWEVQGKGKRRRKKVTKVGKTVITSKSQEVGATSPFEEYDVTSQTKVEFEDIDDTLSPTEELQPQKEIAEMETIKTETPETKVFLTMSEGRVDTAAATQETQITQPTTQILQMITESSIGETQLSTSTMLILTTTEQTQIAVATKDIPLQEEDIQVDSEEKERTTQEPQITEPKTQILEMSEERVDTVITTQENQITEPKAQILETIREAFIGETQLQTISTLAFAQPDQMAITDSSVAMPTLSEDIKLVLVEKKAETSSEFISTVEKDTSSWGWGIQLPVFKIPLFGISEKPANLTESEDSSKHKEELKDETEIKEGKTVVETVSLSVEIEPTTIPKEEVKVELQQEEEKPKPDTDTVKSFETQKEVKESEIVQKELSIQVEPSVQEHWEVQGKGKKRRKKVTKVGKTVITSKSQEIGATSPFEEYDVTSQKKVEFEDIDDTFSPTEELQPQKEIAEIETIKTETPETKVFLTMSEGRVDTAVTTQETQITQPTTQILQMITESSIGETQLSTSTMLTLATTEQTQIAVATKHIPLQEVDIQIDSEEKERTTQEPQITEPKTQILEVSEERVDTVITTQENQITEPKVQILETVREAFIGEKQLQTISTLAFAQPHKTAIADSSSAMSQLSEDIKLELEEKEAETSSEYISTVEKDTSSWGWGIQFPVFKIPLFGKSDEPADLTESEDSSKPKEELKDETEITAGKTFVEFVSLSDEMEPTTVTKEDLKVELQQEEEKTTQEPQITEPKTQIQELSEERVDTVITTQENQITEPKVQSPETVREAFIGETQLQTISTLAFAQPDQTAIADSSVAMPQLSEDIKHELEEKEAETSREFISTVEKDASSWGWGIQLPVFKIPLFEISEKPADLTESEDSSKHKEELKDETEIKEGKTVVETVSLSVEMEPTTVPKEEVKVELQQEEEKPKLDTDTVKSFETQKEVKESEIVQKELSIQVEPSVQEHWEMQGKGKRRRKKVTKVEKTVITIESQEQGATSPFEKYDVTSQTKVEFEDIDDTLSPTEELQPQKEIAEMETIKTETPETKVFLTMSEGRVDTTAATQETQITQPTTQILQMITESSIGETQLSKSTMLTLATTEQTQIAVATKDIPLQEEKIQVDSEEKDRTTQEPQITEPKTQILEVSDERVDTVITTQENQITEPKVQILETVREAFIGETQLQAISTLAFAQPDQTAIADSSVDMPQLSEDIKLELEEKVAETCSECISNVEKDTSSWGWGIQLPVFKIPLFGKSEKPADLTESEDSSKPNEELKDETEITAGKTFVEFVSLSVEMEPTTVTKEDVKVQLQQEDEKPKPDTDTVKSFETQKEVKESEIVQKELSIQVEPSVQEHWEVQGKGKIHRKKVTKVEKTVIMTESQEVGATSSLEKYDVTSQTNIEFEDIDDTLSPTEELQPQKEIAEIKTIKSETPETKVFLTMSEGRVDTSLATQETQITQPTTQILQMITESSIGETQLSTSTMLTFATTEQTQIAVATKDIPLQEEDIQVDSEEKERETTQEPQITEPKTQILGVSEEKVDTAITTQENQITEPNVQILETVREAFIGETQLQTISTLAFAQPDQTAIADISVAMPQLSEDIKLELQQEEEKPKPDTVQLFKTQTKVKDSEIVQRKLSIHVEPSVQEHWEVQDNGKTHTKKFIQIEKTDNATKSQEAVLTSPSEVYVFNSQTKTEFDTDDIKVLKPDYKSTHKQIDINLNSLGTANTKEFVSTSSDITSCASNIWETKSKGVMVTVKNQSEEEQLILNQALEGGINIKGNQSEIKIVEICPDTETLGVDISPIESCTLSFCDFKNDTLEKCTTKSKSLSLLSTNSDQNDVKEAVKLQVVEEHQMTFKTESKLLKNIQDECTFPLKDNYDEANMHTTFLETESYLPYISKPMIGVTLIEESINISGGNIRGKEQKESEENVKSKAEANLYIQEGSAINVDVEVLRKTCDPVSDNNEYEISTPKVQQLSESSCAEEISGVTIPVSPSFSVKVLEERIYTPDEDFKVNQLSFFSLDEVNTTEDRQETKRELQYLKMLEKSKSVLKYKSIPFEETLLENDTSVITCDSTEHLPNYCITDAAKQVGFEKEEQSFRTVAVDLKEKKKDCDLPDMDDTIPIYLADRGIRFHQLSLPKFSVSVIEENIYIEDEGNSGNYLDLERSIDTLKSTVGISSKTIGSETDSMNIMQTKDSKSDSDTVAFEEDVLSAQDVVEEKSDNALQQHTSVGKSRSFFKLPSFKLPSLGFRRKKEHANDQLDEDLDADLPHKDFATDLFNESEKLKTQLEIEADKEKASLYSKKVEHPKFPLPKLELSKLSTGGITEHTSTGIDTSEVIVTKDNMTKNIDTQKEKAQTNKDLSPVSLSSELQANTISVDSHFEEDIKIEFPHFKASQISFVDPNDVQSDNSHFYKPVEKMEPGNSQSTSEELQTSFVKKKKVKRNGHVEEITGDQFLTEEKKDSVSVCLTSVNLSEKKMKPKRSGFKLSFSKVKKSNSSSESQCESFGIAANHEKVDIDLPEYDLACEDELQTVDISCVANQSTLELNIPQSDVKAADTGLDKASLNEMEKAMKKEINIAPINVKSITFDEKSSVTAEPFDTDHGVPHLVSHVSTELPVSSENREITVKKGSTNKLVDVYSTTVWETKQNTETEYKSNGTTQTKQDLTENDKLSTKIVKEYEISSAETENPSFGFSLMKIKLPESRCNVNREESEMSVEENTNIEDNQMVSENTQSLEVELENITAENKSNRLILSSKVHIPKVKTLKLSVKSYDQPESSNIPAHTDDGTAKNEMSATAATSHDENSLKKKEDTSNQSLKFRFRLPSIGFTSSANETDSQHSIQKLQGTAKLEKEETGTSEKKSWFKFPKLGFSSTTEKHEIDKTEKDDSELVETTEDNFSKESKEKDKREDSS
ncbi:hypothetical protein XELAEV_18039755mg [Xenopus laevis]|uniref:PDZ domain-containing protein n=1 Tax=Xenopus laevis TaxID=8355 RepID=A0A974C8D7_XENLA|nr:hypothetical protein XELAEV_18039755mg [Xenopus laevis]